MTNVVDMQVQKRLIQEAKEAREKRRAERENDSWARRHKPEYPGGIDDIEV